MRYTEAQHAFMREFVPGHSYKEIRDEFNRRFGTELTTSRVKSYIGKHKLNTGRTGHFPKGNIPPNKGKKVSKEAYEKSKTTMFRKGNIPVNKDR